MQIPRAVSKSRAVEPRKGWGKRGAECGMGWIEVLWSGAAGQGCCWPGVLLWDEKYPKDEHQKPCDALG